MNLVDYAPDGYDTVEKMMGLAYRLRQFNEWRRGDDSEMPCPKQIGIDLDAVILIVEEVAEAMRQ